MNDLRSDELLTACQVQEVLGVGRTKLYEMVRAGELPVIRIGRLVRIPRAELDRWLRERLEAPRAA